MSKPTPVTVSMLREWQLEARLQQKQGETTSLLAPLADSINAHFGLETPPEDSSLEATIEHLAKWIERKEAN